MGFLTVPIKIKKTAIELIGKQLSNKHLIPKLRQLDKLSHLHDKIMRNTFLAIRHSSIKYLRTRKTPGLKKIIIQSLTIIIKIAASLAKLRVDL